MPDGRVVSESCRGPGGHRAMAASLQRGAAAHESGRSDARRVQEPDQEPERLVRREPDERRFPVISGPKKPGTSVDLASTGARALHVTRSYFYDAIVLDQG